MSSFLRRLAAASVAVLVGAAAVLVAPGQAGAAVLYPAPEEVYGGAFYDGDEGAYGIEWEVPEPTNDADVVLTGYESVVRTGAPAFATVVATNSTTAIGAGVSYFRQLTVGQQYQGGVRAVYAVNTDADPEPESTEYSEWENGGVEKPLYPAPSPTSVKAVATGPGVITVSWRAPSVPANTQNYLAFGVDVSPSFDFEDESDDDQFDSSSKVVSRSTTSTTIKRLRPGIVYDVTVFSLAGFFGDIGDTGSTTVRALGSPGKPKGLKVKTLEGKKSKLSWRGVPSTAGAPVAGYKVYVNGKLKSTLGKGARSWTARGQKAGKKYTYVVKAYNRVGASAPASVTKRRPSS